MEKDLAQLRKSAAQNAAALMYPEYHGKAVVYDVDEKNQVKKLIKKAAPAPKVSAPKKAKVLDFTQEQLIELGYCYVEQWLPAKRECTKFEKRKSVKPEEMGAWEEWDHMFQVASEIIGPLTEGQRVRAAAAYRKSLQKPATLN